MHAMDFKQSRRLWLENMLITEFELCSTQCLLATVALQMREQPVGNERGVVAVFMALEEISKVATDKKVLAAANSALKARAQLCPPSR